MEAIKTNKALRAELEQVKEALGSLEDQHIELQEQLEAANAEIVNKDESIATLTASNGELEEANDSLSAALETTQADLVKAQEDVVAAENSANSKAVAIAASAGHTEKVEPEDTSDPLEVTRADFNNMKPGEKSNFAKSGGKIKPE